MSVLLETSVGDIVLDLFCDDCPKATKNFLKLCKIKYFNGCLFHNVQKNFIVQCGDPTGTGKGGESIYEKLYGKQARYFEDEIRPHLKHKKVGTLSMANAGPNTNASQFFITTGSNLDYLDEKHTVFGELAEGLDILMKINDTFLDEHNRPLKNIRIRHTIVLDDPFPDPPMLAELIPATSPIPKHDEHDIDHIPDDLDISAAAEGGENIDVKIQQQEAQSRAEVLEMIGDLPAAEVKPPENVLFVCKLNPVTKDEDLELIFSRFGKIIECQVGSNVGAHDVFERFFFSLLCRLCERRAIPPNSFVTLSTLIAPSTGCEGLEDRRQLAVRVYRV